MGSTTIRSWRWAGVVCLLFAAGAQAQGPVKELPRGGDRPVAAEPDTPSTSAPVQSNSQAVIPRLIKFGGLVRDLAGKPLTGPIEVTFALYLEEAGGAPLWFETQTVEADSLGHYTALLGAMTPAGLPAELFTSAEAHWLGVQAGNLPEQARVLLVSVPYALKAADAETLGGKPASAFVLAESEAAPGADSKQEKTTSSGKQSAKGPSQKKALKSNGVQALLSTTTNRIPMFADGTGTLTDSVLAQSGSSIGLGTTLPLAPLHITTIQGHRSLSLGSLQTGAFPGIMLENTTTGGSLAVTENSGFSLYIKNSTVANFTPSDLKMVVNQSGNVGIGTTAPGGLLEVSKSQNAGTVIRITNADNVGAVAYSALRFYQGANLRAGVVSVNDGLASAVGGPGAMQIWNTANGNMVFGTNNTEKLRITSAGNVGIGTTIPVARLDVVGNINLPQSTSAIAGVITMGGQAFAHTCCHVWSGAEANTFVGPGSGNLTMTGLSNAALGYHTLLSITNGGGNTAVGSYALALSTSGSNNVAIGKDALLHNTTGTQNTAVGVSALEASTTTSFLTAVGYGALQNNTTGGGNAAFGSFSLQNNTTGTSNTAVGYQALSTNTTSCCSTAVGNFALFSNTGVDNTAVGQSAMGTNSTGIDNTAVGLNALNQNTTGNENTALGVNALFSNSTGSDNIAVGPYAGENATTGNFNIYIGNVGVAAEGATIRIGDSHQTKAFIAGIRGVTTANANAVAVLIDSAGQLGTVSSSRRFKEDIHDMADASQRLLRLRPVVFRYRQPSADGSKPLQYGLVAEEVAEVFPELVAYGADGQPETVKYHVLPAILLNELQRQETRLAEKDQQIEELTRQVRELSKVREQVAALETKLARVEARKQKVRAPLVNTTHQTKRFVQAHNSGKGGKVGG